MREYIFSVSVILFDTDKILSASKYPQYCAEMGFKSQVEQGFLPNIFAIFDDFSKWRAPKALGYPLCH